MNTVPRHPDRKIAHAVTACMFVALLACAGCDTRTLDPNPAANNPPVANPALETNASSHDASDAAKYEFRRNVAFTNVTKDIPDGSVDYIDFGDMTHLAAPNVIVVVTVTAPQRDSISFTTTFIGTNELRIKRQWSPATDHDGKYVGLFVLPAEVNSASTIVE